MKKTWAWGIIAAAIFIGCPPPPPPPPPPNACESIKIPAVAGPGSGTNTLCVAPTDCREDTMTQMLDGQFCDDRGGQCASGTSSCSNKCVGVVLNSGLQVTPGSCSWDRNSECKTAAGAAGGKCTCSWTIPAGSSLSCGCGCK